MIMKTIHYFFFLVLTLLCQLTAMAQEPVLVKDIFTADSSSNPKYLTEYNGKIYFQANDGIHGTELWASDGTEAGTAMVKDISPDSFSSNPCEFKVYDGKLYFQAADSNLAELWVTDGTEAGTHMVKNINTAPWGNGTEASLPSELTVYNGKLYFSAQNIDLATGTGRELWVTDGTEAGTHIVKDIRVGDEGSYPAGLTVFNGRLYFAAAAGTPNTELWATDGTEQGTVLVKDINNGSSGGPRDFVIFKNRLYFRADDGIHGWELWVSDGTESGTALFKDLYPGGQDGNPKAFMVWNEKMYFSAWSSANNIHLWVTDGTASGTTIIQTPSISSPSEIYPGYRDHLIYHASLYQGTKSGDLLLKSDGTGSGTEPIKILNTHIDNLGFDASVGAVIENNGRLYFSAKDGTSKGEQLWVSDGTEDSTFQILPPSGYLPDAVYTETSNIISFNNYLYYVAKYKSNVGAELYKVTMSPPSNDTTTGVGTINFDNIALYPNPVDGYLHIDNLPSNTMININNILGQTIFSSDNNPDKIRIDLKGWANGIYFVNLTNKKGKKETRKIIKK